MDDSVKTAFAVALALSTSCLVARSEPWSVTLSRRCRYRRDRSACFKRPCKLFWYRRSASRFDCCRADCAHPLAQYRWPRSQLLQMYTTTRQAAQR